MNGDSATRRDIAGRDSRRATAIIAGKDAATGVNHDIAGCSRTVELGKNADTESSRGCDIGGGDADTARPGCGIIGTDAGADTPSHDGATACVDSDTGVRAIGGRRYSVIVVAAAAGDIADCGYASDVDIAAGASSCIGEDAAPVSAGDSAGSADSLYRDVPAARDSLDTNPAGEV